MSLKQARAASKAVEVSSKEYFGGLKVTTITASEVNHVKQSRSRPISGHVT